MKSKITFKLTTFSKAVKGKYFQYFSVLCGLAAVFCTCLQFNTALPVFTLRQHVFLFPKIKIFSCLHSFYVTVN